MANTGAIQKREIVSLSFKAAAAITKFVAVELNSSDDTVNYVDSDGAQALGIALNTGGAAGDTIKVCMVGVCQAIAHTSISKGALLQSYSDGKVYAATTSDYVLGIALEAAGAANDIITILVCPMGIY